MTTMTIRNRPAEGIVGAQASEESSLDTLYVGLVRDYHKRIYNYVFRIVGDTETAEDLTQETFLRAYRGLPKLPPGANHRAWLFRIASNAATDELRRRKRRPSVPMGVVPRLRAQVESEDERIGRVCLDKALMDIAPHHRVTIMLFEFAEFTAPQVGTQTTPPSLSCWISSALGARL